MNNSDLIGQRFGKLIVIDRAEDVIQPSGRHVKKWNCLCDCGNTTNVNRDYLTRTESPCCLECGRKKAARSRMNDLTGKEFGELTVLSRSENKGKKITWLCRCRCGNQTVVIGANLVSGNTKHCKSCKGRAISAKKLKDLTGQRFGRWTVLKRDVSVDRMSGNAYWICRCDCGKEKSVNSRNLVSGKSTSCGCYRAENPNHAYDLTGMRFGRLSVISKADEKRDSYIMWNCICDCGNSINVRSSSLLKGDTKSCGCYHSDRASESLTHDLTGMKFGKLLVIERATGDFGHAYWKCQCDCGNVIEPVDGYNLTHSLTVSCGCINSKLEIYVMKYLIDKGYKAGEDFETHKTFKDNGLKGINNGLLSYDFCLWDRWEGYDEPVIKCLIECQGEQHYHPVELFGGEKQFQIQKAHDIIKRQHAKWINVPLIEIPYTENTYEKVSEYLNKNGL